MASLAACSDLPTAVEAPTESQMQAQAQLSAILDVGPMVASLVADPIVNGSFETGDFTGWTTTGPGDPAWQASGAGAGGDNGMDTTQPQDGSFVAWNRFDGFGPTTFTLYQDVALPTDSVELSWKYRAQWTSFASENLPRSADFELRDPVTGDVLASLHHFDTGPMDADPAGDTGWQSVTAGYRGTAGETVRIFVNVYVGDLFPGPGQFEVDAFAMTGIEPPPTEPPSDPEPGPGIDPTTKDDCKKDGWTDFGFKNQGQCVRFVETGKDSR